MAYAIVVGILKKEDVSSEVLDALAGPLTLFEGMEARGELRKPD